MQLPYPIRALGHGLLGRVPARILSGPNKGLRWSLVTLGRGFGSGRFGANRLEALAGLVRKGDCFWDVGAHKGFVTLAGCRMVGPDGRVVAVEPSSTNLRFLRQHLAWNHAPNVDVIPAALSDEAGEASFGGRGSSIAYRIGVGDETVQVKTVEGVVEECGVPPPSVMKIDVEGEEARVLRGARRFLTGELALLISTHSRGDYEECLELLEPRGFRVFESWEIASRSRDRSLPWASDHDMLAVGPDRQVDEARVRSLQLIRGPGPPRSI